MQPLPPTNDEYWKDSETLTIEKIENKAPDKHYVVWQGGHAVCISCPYKHTVPLPPNAYIKDGNVVIDD